MNPDEIAKLATRYLHLHRESADLQDRLATSLNEMRAIGNDLAGLPVRGIIVVGDKALRRVGQDWVIDPVVSLRAVPPATEDLSPLLTEFIRRAGADRARALLAEHGGATRLSAVAPDRLPTLKTALTTALGKEC
jgi:hypothetical protein